MDTEPGIYRPEFPIDSNFTMVPNALIRDQELSPTAKLLLIYLFSHKVGYQILDDQIMRETGLGRHALRTARNELEEFSFIELVRVRQDDNSWGGYRYELGDPRGYFSTVDSSTVGHSTVANRPDNRKLISNKTKEEKTTSIDSGTAKPKPKDADSYQPSEAITADFEERYPGLRLDIELEKFRDHHMANGSQFKDWDRAMRKWLRQASEWSKEARAVRASMSTDSEWEQWKKENGY